MSSKKERKQRERERWAAQKKRRKNISHEPGCAVKAAVAGGELADWRLENYVKLYAELG